MPSSRPRRGCPQHSSRRSQRIVEAGYVSGPQGVAPVMTGHLHAGQRCHHPVVQRINAHMLIQDGEQVEHIDITRRGHPVRSQEHLDFASQSRVLRQSRLCIFQVAETALARREQR